MALTWYRYFQKKWWVESDFTAPNLPRALQFKGQTIGKPNNVKVSGSKKTNGPKQGSKNQLKSDMSKGEQ